ncbi:hypothetical protein A3H21_01255 [Candidatus Woesebacteria bacterium RIFCSPLOWO2_12_FULL_42_8]|nr:MAG: hypothetical protein A3H21_01255 [Candidatus Woesebacteria bacterium RIFCSPLOWO2_12_FULL_42_8]
MEGLARATGDLAQRCPLGAGCLGILGREAAKSVLSLPFSAKTGGQSKPQVDNYGRNLLKEVRRVAPPPPEGSTSGPDDRAFIVFGIWSKPKPAGTSTSKTVC